MAESVSRPSIGIMSFSGEVFDGTSMNIGDGKAYGKLKRCVVARAGDAVRVVSEPGVRRLSRAAQSTSMRVRE
jgi:hypothetical protein